MKAQRISPALFVCFCLAVRVGAQTPSLPADVWVTNFVRFPSGSDTNQIRLTGFETLRSEVNAGRLKILCTSQPSNTNATIVVVASADEQYLGGLVLHEDGVGRIVEGQTIVAALVGDRDAGPMRACG